MSQAEVSVEVLVGGDIAASALRRISMSSLPPSEGGNKMFCREFSTSPSASIIPEVDHAGLVGAQIEPLGPLPASLKGLLRFRMMSVCVLDTPEMDRNSWSTPRCESR